MLPGGLSGMRRLTVAVTPTTGIVLARPVPDKGASLSVKGRGRMSDRLLARFDTLEARLEPVETVMHGPVRDQAELHSILEQVQTLGLELIEVRRLSD